MTAVSIPVNADVTSSVSRLTTVTARCTADPAQPVSSAIDVSVEPCQLTGLPAVVITVWGINEGLAAMIPPDALLGLLKALVEAGREASGSVGTVQ